MSLSDADKREEPGFKRNLSGSSIQSRKKKGERPRRHKKTNSFGDAGDEEANARERAGDRKPRPRRREAGDSKDRGETRRKRTPTRTTSKDGHARKPPTRVKSISDEQESTTPDTGTGPVKGLPPRTNSTELERSTPARTTSDNRRTSRRADTGYKGRRAKMQSSAPNLNFDHLAADVDDDDDYLEDEENSGEGIGQQPAENENNAEEPEAAKKSKVGKKVAKLVKKSISTIDPRKKKSTTDEAEMDDDAETGNKRRTVPEIADKVGLGTFVRNIDYATKTIGSMLGPHEKTDTS